jgi:hypothetical protein
MASSTGQKAFEDLGAHGRLAALLRVVVRMEVLREGVLRGRELVRGSSGGIVVVTYAHFGQLFGRDRGHGFLTVTIRHHPLALRPDGRELLAQVRRFVAEPVDLRLPAVSLGGDTIQ